MPYDTRRMNLEKHLTRLLEALQNKAVLSKSDIDELRK